jgi:hypothetical protein
MTIAQPKKSPAAAPVKLADFTATRRMLPIAVLYGSERIRGRLLGKLALHHLLSASMRHLEEEQRSQRILPWQYILPPSMRPCPRMAPSAPRLVRAPGPRTVTHEDDCAS